MLRSLTLVSLLITGCQVPCTPPPAGEGVFPVPGVRSNYHRLRFTDGQVSTNDSCMIRLGNRLNPRIAPLYVNGEPMGFC